MSEKKKMGLWAAVSIGIGGMIGAGIFSILGVGVEIAGSGLYISFIIAGLIALLCTYSYAKLGSRYPSAGGAVEFLVRGFGDGLLSGSFNLLLWVGYIFALALYARAFGGYAMTFLASGISDVWLNVLITSVILLFTFINFMGARAVGKSELFIVGVKVGILCLFIVVGLYFIDLSTLSFSEFPGSHNILFAAGIVFVGYEGFGLITNAADEMERPEKTLPMALFISVTAVIAIYVLVSVTVLGNLSVADIVGAKDYALAAAAQPIMGDAGFTFISVAALFSTASAINATLFGGANVSYIMAKYGELPKIFERKIWVGGTGGLFLTAGMVLIFANFLPLESIAMLGSASFLLIYGAVNVGHLRLYRDTGANPWIILASTISCFAFLGILSYYLMVDAPVTLLLLVVVIVAVFVIEWGFRFFNHRVLKTGK